MATATAASFRIISPCGDRLQVFSFAGNHQMLVQVFRRTASGWNQTEGGWMWLGSARSRWAELRCQGWRQAV